MVHKPFHHCRPLITIDDTQMYGKYKQVMLIATVIDANNQLFPLAFSIVEGENNDSWRWFLLCLRRFVTDRDGICVISDRADGIMEAFRDLPEWQEPRAYHMICLRHLKSNVNKKYKNLEIQPPRYEKKEEGGCNIQKSRNSTS